VADAAAEELILRLNDRQGRMKTYRSVFDSHWQEVALRVFPENDTFLASHVPGTKRSERIFDSTAVRALPRFAAAMMSLIVPATQKWHDLSLDDPQLAENDEVEAWLEAVRDIMFAVRSQPRSRFYQNVYQVMRQIGAFGNGPMFVDDLPGKAIMYRAIDLANVWWEEDYCGAIDIVHRTYDADARRLLQEFGTLPPKIAQNYDSANPQKNRKYKVLHAIEPNPKIDYSRLDMAGKPYLSSYICLDTREILSQGGYSTFPWCIGRYDQAAGENYGRGPAMEALADIKSLNEMSKSTLRAGQRAVEPPLLAFEDGILQAFSTRSNAINYGGLDAQGRELLKPLQTGGNLQLGLDMENQRRDSINDSFLVTLWKLIVENPNMTATAVLTLAQEKGELLGPVAGRLQSDLLGPMIERELDILGRAGVLPAPPDVVLQAGAKIKVVYSSPLNRIARASEAVAIQRWFEIMTPMAQIDPSALDTLDPDRAAKELAEILGVPSQVQRTDVELAALKDQRAQQAQAEMLIKAAPVASGTVKDLADAQAKAASAPQPASVLPMAA
jgi:hypothetical protein